MDLGCLPPLSMGLMSAAARDLAHRVVQVAEAAQLRMPSWPATVVSAAVLAAWLVNSIGWGHGELSLLVALCSGSLVATSALAIGWATDPEELERWAGRALAAAFASALPALAA